MKKLAGALVAGLLLAASQAAAAGANSDVVQVNDRVGAQGEGSNHLMDASAGTWIGLAAFAAVLAVGVAETDRGDRSTSP